MSRDEERARELVKRGWNLSHNWMELPATANDLIREVAQALARERLEENEACATLAEGQKVTGQRAGHVSDSYDQACTRIAAAIRARQT